MKWVEMRGEAKAWFEKGVNQGASYMLVACNIKGKYYPIFVFPEQDIEVEVVRFIKSKDTLLGVIILSDNPDHQINTILRPPNMITSKIEN
jgi:hypothetical protein